MPWGLPPGIRQRGLSLAHSCGYAQSRQNTLPVRPCGALSHGGCGTSGGLRGRRRLCRPAGNVARFLGYLRQLVLVALGRTHGCLIMGEQVAVGSGRGGRPRAREGIRRRDLDVVVLSGLNQLGRRLDRRQPSTRC
jgi:hypothetical protein